MTATPTDIVNIYNNYHLLPISSVPYYQISAIEKEYISKLILMPTITKNDVLTTFRLYNNDEEGVLNYYEIPKKEESFYIQLTLDRLGAYTGGGESGNYNPYISTFTSTDERWGEGNFITFTHNLDTPITHLTIKNNLGNTVIPDEVLEIDSNTIQVGLSTYSPIDGLWYVKLS